MMGVAPMPALILIGIGMLFGVGLAAVVKEIEERRTPPE